VFIACKILLIGRGIHVFDYDDSFSRYELGTALLPCRSFLMLDIRRRYLPLLSLPLRSVWDRTDLF
jgi:hypothetical protein